MEYHYHQHYRLAAQYHDGMNSLQFSTGSSMSSHNLNDIVLHLATSRSDRSQLYLAFLFLSLLFFLRL